MRSCIYCGRELEKGEVCMCPQSVARRAKRTNTESEKTTENSKSKNTVNTDEQNRTTYKTGYTKKQSKAARAWNRYKARRESRRTINTDGMFKSFVSFVRSFIKSPVDKIINPPNIGKGMMLTIAALQGAVTWLCLYFVYTGASRSAFSVLGSVLGFGGIAGYSSLARMLLCILFGAVSGIVMFFVYTGIFYFINKVIFKSKTQYWDFSTRLSLTGIPLTVLGIAGVLLSFFSLTTLVILLLCGLISLIVLTYEALCTEWITKSPGSVMYAMMAGFFVFLSIVCYLIRVS
ncbi:MAG: hypothetical protein LIO59_02675 [Oscillospiraceae bacterium]|nr:hypothetical protein [Oscillospiraceae bacterium]